MVVKAKRKCHRRLLKCKDGEASYIRWLKRKVRSYIRWLRSWYKRQDSKHIKVHCKVETKKGEKDIYKTARLGNGKFET